MMHQVSRVACPVDDRVSPQGGGVENGGVHAHVGEEHARLVNFELPDECSVGLHGKTAPHRGASGAVVGADPEVIFGRSALHGGGDDCFPDVVVGIVDDRFAGVVIGVEHHLRAERFVRPTQFWKAVVVTDGNAASDASDFEGCPVIAGRIVSEVEPGVLPLTAGAEAFVVAIGNVATRVDDVNTVVRADFI